MSPVCSETAHEHPVTTSTDMTFTLQLPRLAGSRQDARDLALTVPGYVDTVTLDFTGCVSVAQGYCDELVMVLCQEWDFAIELVGANDRVRAYIDRAIELRVR